MPKNFDSDYFINKEIKEKSEEEKIKKLEGIIEKNFLQLKEKIPINKELRLDMMSFSEIYSEKEILKDLENAKKIQNKNCFPEEERLKRTGEQLEILKTIIF
ncbi:MAG: hypothetical protein ABH971_02945 [bacterium]